MSDAFVLLESAQYTKSLVHSINGQKIRKKSYQSDTIINSPSGEHLLTVPIKHNNLNTMHTTAIDYSTRWNKKHISTIKNFYSKSTNSVKTTDDIRQLLNAEYASLAELNIKTILWGVASILNLNLNTDDISLQIINKYLKRNPTTRLKHIYSDTELSATRPDGSQKGTEWTTAICQELDATEYFHGATAKNNYMDENYYNNQGIRLITQDWKCQEYEQLFLDKHPFLSNLSIVDLLYNTENSTAQKIVGLT